MSVTPAIGRAGHDLAPTRLRSRARARWADGQRRHGAVVAELLAERGAAFGDAAVHRGVGRAGDAHDLGVAVAEALEIERLSLSRLEGVDGLQAGVVLD